LRGSGSRAGAQQRSHRQRNAIPLRVIGANDRGCVLERLASKWSLAGDHLVEDHAERPHIHTGVGGSALFVLTVAKHERIARDLRVKGTLPDEIAGRERTTSNRRRESR
jgi:hypothetical protein